MDERLKELAQEICENLNPDKIDRILTLFFKKSAYYIQEDSENEKIEIKNKENKDFSVELKLENEKINSKIKTKREFLHPAIIANLIRNKAEKYNFEINIIEEVKLD